MADLTSTIAITGSINGRKINVTSSMTLEDIYDAGITIPDDAGMAYSSIGFGGNDAALSFTQDCPTYLFSANRSPSETAAVALENAAGTDVRYLVLAPGQFAILGEYTNGAGMVNASATATNITLQELNGVYMSRHTDYSFVVRMDHMVAFQAVS